MAVNSSLAQFKAQFGDDLSWADLLQIAGMTAVEIAGNGSSTLVYLPSKLSHTLINVKSGGPKFIDFQFSPGRLDNADGLVSLDGLLPNAGELANMK